MKPTKIWLIAIVIVTFVAVCLTVSKTRVASPEKQKFTSASAAKPVAPSVTRVRLPSAPPPVEEKIEVPSSVQFVQAPPAEKTIAAPQNNKPDEPRRDLVARAALSLVGINPEAEQYWLAAICDSTRSEQEREDLMEDLNEEGLANPQQPDPEDFPLIVNRIRIIEEIAPYADDFMLEHLGEAYNDLVHLASSGTAR